MGSPPPPTSKKDVFKFRSVKSIVMAPASTGKDKRRRIAVSRTDHGNKRGFIFLFFVCILVTVEIKLAAPRMDLAPAICSEKIAIFTGGPLWAVFPARGGYIAHPVPASFLIMALIKRRVKAGIRSQNLILFIRGKVISGPVIMRGVNQFPNPPIITGITRKKIIRKAWAVTRVL